MPVCNSLGELSSAVSPGNDVSSIFAFAAAHRRRIRTANGLERLNREVLRRSRVAVLFPNEASCLRLVTAVLMEISDEWETSRAYFRLSENIDA
jgi:transposase-like protein